MPRKPKKSTLGQATDSPAAYVEFLSKLRLVGLGLKSSTTALDRKLFWQLAEDESKSLRRFTESYRPSEVGDDFFEIEGRYEVVIGTSEKEALRIECTFQVHMHSTARIDTPSVERFAKSDVRFVLLPYARLFVTDVTGQMQIPPVILPLATATGKARVAGEE
jgi:hypothetical protein